MTSPHDSPLMDPHGDHAGHGHGHDHHHHDHPLDVIEAPLDPASQSLSDALRASFRVLKAIMLIVLILFLFSGVYRVGQNERVIESHLGALQPASEPGLHITWPYPIAQRTTIQISAQTLEVDSFWLNLSDAEKKQAREQGLSALSPRGQTLEPATDGALLSGDHAIMHLQMRATYSITDPSAYVRNVSDRERLLRAVLREAAIAEAGRTSSTDILKDAASLTRRIRERAQTALTGLNSGITIENLTGDSTYPLQTKDEFLRVSEAENSKEEARQGALSAQANRLNGVAGEAWRELYEQIQLLDQHKAGPQYDEILKKIDDVLTAKATGQAGGAIRLAMSQREEIINGALQAVAEFKAHLSLYQENPELLRQRLRQRTLAVLYNSKGVSKWSLPGGDKQMFLSFSKDPIQVRETEEELMKLRVEGQK